MKKQLIKDEFIFLVTLKELCAQSLLRVSINGGGLPKGFDFVKGISVINRIMDSEIEYLHENPEDYLEIYN